MFLIVCKAMSRLQRRLSGILGNAPAVGLPMLNQSESLEALVGSDKSFVRFGDGEATIIEGGDLYFQRNSVALRKALKEILRTYSAQSDYLVAMPIEFLAGPERPENRIWAKSRFIFAKLLADKADVPLLDAFMFREDTSLGNAEIRSIWAAYKTVFFVHSNFKYFSDFRDRNPENNVYFSAIYGANAYITVPKVLQEITAHHKALGPDQTPAIALVGGGPAGKIIVKELAKAGIRAIDIGHYFDYKFYDLSRSDRLE